MRIPIVKNPEPYQSGEIIAAQVIKDVILANDSNEEIREQLDELMEVFEEFEGGREILKTSLRVAEEALRDQIIERKLLPRFSFTRDDFLSTDEPYDYVFWFLINGDKHEHAKQTDLMNEEAKLVKFTGFRRRYKEYVESRRAVKSQDSGENKHPTHFPNQPIELDSGPWICDSEGVRIVTPKCMEVACCHPILPVQRLVNIDTGEEKLVISFFKSKRWRSITVPKEIVAVASKITQLAANGVAVTSENAKYLVRYLCDIENQNIEIIPETESVGRLGYVEGGFSPFVESLTFDGDKAYKVIFDSIVSPKGDFDVWKEEVKKVRAESLAARIMISASFASPLIEIVGGLPFFTHMWSSESGTGKTVSLMVAASIWGNPEPGLYIQSFNSTSVGHEKMAAFLNSIPMCIDELQLSKDSHGHSKFDVYGLAQGVGRTRGNKAGGVEKTPTWKNTILTTGETPIVRDGAGAGAVNRVIDLEVPIGQKVVMDGQHTSNVVKQNYGYAGREYIKNLDKEKVQKLYDMYFETLNKGDTTEKQSMAAALILAADGIVSEMFFDEAPLPVDKMSQFLKSKSSVSAGERGYEYICGWVAMNIKNFITINSGDAVPVVYGLKNGTCPTKVFIVRSIFRKVCEDGGYDDRALLSYFKSKGLIETRGRKLTLDKRVDGVHAECVALFLPDREEETGDSDIKPVEIL